MKNEKFTLEKFFDLLPIVDDRKWTIRKNGTLRDEYNRCPICAVVNALDPDILHEIFAREALEKLGVDFNENMIKNVMSAADWERKSRIRSKMVNILKPTRISTPLFTFPLFTFNF